LIALIASIYYSGLNGEKMKIDHIGYAVNNIDEAKKVFGILGYEDGEIIFDEERKVNISFITNATERIELIAPLDKNSPISAILKKNGATPYHICYSVDNIEQQIVVLQKANCILVQSPAPAAALSNKKVAFLYNKHIGLFELLERGGRNKWLEDL
jgi:methylmalonyl-CoA/ethylmalonyl-CoA epimerase